MFKMFKYRCYAKIICSYKGGVEFEKNNFSDVSGIFVFSFPITIQKSERHYHLFCDGAV